MVPFLRNSGLFFLPISVQPALPLTFEWQRPLLRNTHCVNLPVPLNGAAKVLVTPADLITLSLFTRFFHSNTLRLLILPFISLHNSSLSYFNLRIYHFSCLPFLPLHQCCCFSPIEDFVPGSKMLLLPFELIVWFPSSSLVHALVNICWFTLSNECLMYLNNHWSMDWDVMPLSFPGWMLFRGPRRWWWLKKKITLNGTTNLQLSCTKQNSFSRACRLAARAVFWKTEDILSPAAEEREWSPNCRAIRWRQLCCPVSPPL